MSRYTQLFPTITAQFSIQGAQFSVKFQVLFSSFLWNLSHILDTPNSINSLLHYEDQHDHILFGKKNEMWFV